MLYRHLGKTASYAVLSPRLAAIASAVYMIVILPGVLFVYWAGWLSTAMAFGLMGLASLGSGLWVFRRLGLVRTPIRRNPLTRKVLHDHWIYGRWASATGVLMWIPGQVYYFVLPLLIDLESAAQLKALTNLIMPASHAFSAIGFLLVPVLVRLRDQDYFIRVLIFGMALFSALAALYWLALGLFSEPIMLWLYDGQYTSSSRLPWIIGLIPIITGNVVWLGAALRALERPNLVFWCYALSSSTTITIGLLLVARLGLEGSIWGMIAASATTAIAMIWFLFVKKMKPREIETFV
jgi:O-antigen/teichoic acid export membrane protein